MLLKQAIICFIINLFIGNKYLKNWINFMEFHWHLYLYFKYFIYIFLSVLDLASFNHVLHAAAVIQCCQKFIASSRQNKEKKQAKSRYISLVHTSKEMNKNKA